MKRKSLAYTLLIPLLGLVSIGPLALSRTAEARNGGIPMARSNGPLTTPGPNFTVTNLNDNGPGSLRQAILDSNINPGADVIDFSVTGTITLMTGELLIADNLSIVGPAGNLTISGNNAFRVFEVVAGVSVMFSNLTISYGNAGLGSGGGILNKGGTVTITNCTVSGNSAGGGGGITSFGTTTISNSTVSNNFAISGGGVQNVGGATIITNSTVSTNLAGAGAGIEVFSPVSSTTIANTTVVNNTAFNLIGGIRLGGPVNIKNSIVANNNGTNCFGPQPLTASSTNFSTDSSCGGFTQVTSAQLNLGPLANNGGPTLTHALLAGSVAIDAVTDCTDLFAAPVSTDQRGVARPLDGDGDGVPRCDAGAYEAASPFDLCIQDDSSGYKLKINSITGEYQFTNCAGITLNGTGTLNKRGNILTLQQYAIDRRVVATVDRGANKATASIQTNGMTLTITDRNTANDTCACSAN
jgi:hypothetical protein